MAYIITIDNEEYDISEYIDYVGYTTLYQSVHIYLNRPLSPYYMLGYTLYAEDDLGNILETPRTITKVSYEH
jgi:hypothetical protein